MFVVPADGAAPPRLVREERHRAPVRPDRAAHSTSATGATTSPCSRACDLSGARRTGALPVGERHADRAVARRQVGRVRRALPRVRGRRSRDPGARSTSARRSRRYPVARISRDAGLYLHWSGDSRRVHWALGPGTLHARPRAHLHVPRLRSSRRPDEPESKGMPIGFDAESDVPDRHDRARRRAHRHDGGRRAPRRDGDAAPVIERGTIVVERNRIIAIGPAVRSQCPAGRDARSTSPARRSSRASWTCTRHVGGEGDGIIAQANWPFAGQPGLRGHDVARSIERHRDRLHERRADPRPGAKLGPRLFSTGTILYGAETPFKAVVETYDDALVAPAAHEGGRRLQREELQPAAPRRAPDDPQGGARAGDGGRARGRLARLPERDDGARRPHRRGARAARAATSTRTSITLFAKSGTGYTPTLIVGYGGLNGRGLLVPAHRTCGRTSGS